MQNFYLGRAVASHRLGWMFTFVLIFFVFIYDFSGCWRLQGVSEYILSLYLEEYLGFISKMNEIYSLKIFSSLITSSYRATL